MQNHILAVITEADLRGLNKYQNPYRDRLLKKAIRNTANYLKAQLKQRVNPLSESKALFKSFSVKMVHYKNNGTICAIVGPRTDFTIDFQNTTRRPKNYWHLVDKGRKAISTAGWKSHVYFDFTRNAWVHIPKIIPAAPPHNILDSAFDVSKSSMIQIMERTISQGFA